jgi:Carboxypeptidase regulatory-like domain/TonB-dependent Receptor Plug Domain
MRARTLVALVCALALAAAVSPAFAQDQRGSIEGIVRDSSGAVLPGVTVEVRNAAGVVVATTTDEAGVYRFPSLVSGTYSVKAELAGFAARSLENVDVSLGQIKKVDFALAVAGVQESVQVTAESPLVDVKQSARSTNIKAEQVELLPHGRDFTTLVTQAPGANFEQKLGGLSIDGASAGENRYIIDGIETTDLQDGTSAKALIADFLEEVQVKSSGYTAEYGGATGGVVNAITKSGTNAYHGTGLLYFEGSALGTGNCPTLGTCAGGRPTLRQNLANDSIAEYVDYPEDDRSRFEPGFSIGGPIIQNRAWFFGAYQPTLITNKRTVGSQPEITQKQQVQYATASQTAQWTDTVRSRVSFNNSWNRTEGLLPALNGTDPAGTNYGKTSTFPNYSVSGNVDYVASPRLFFAVRGGYFLADQHDTNVTELPRYRWTTTTNIGLPGVPAHLQHGTNFSSIPDNNKVTRDKFTRANFQADATVYARLGGEHQFKFGVQADRLGNDVLSGESRNLVTIRWNAPLPTGVPVQRGQFGYYEVRSNAVAPKQGFITEGDISMNVIGLFIQDAWTIGNRFTINAGVRTEKENVPTYTVGQDIPEFGVEFDFADKIAPRLGFAYDVKGDGRWKAFGSWGVFYDIFKLELPRGSFGGDKWLSYYYTLDTPDWTTLVDGPNCPPVCSGTIIRGAPTPDNPIGGIDFRHPSFGSDAIDPDLKPMKQQEATAGIEHQLNDVVALSARYVHKHVDRAIEDTGSLDAAGNEIYVIANPGFGLTALAHTDPDVALPKAKRQYDSVEFAAEKRLSNNWYLRASYLWSRLHGNFTGLSQSDENGRTSPNIGRMFDYPMMMFQDGGIPVDGPLPTDRPHQFKANFLYQFGFGTSVGLVQYAASGLPVTREIGIYPTSNLPVQYLGRGSDGRTPIYSQTDLLIQHDFRVMGDRRFQVNLNVLNLFDQGTAVGRHSTYHKTNGVVPDEVLFYNGQQTLAQLIQARNVVIDPRFLMDNQFQLPLQARIGFKFIF